MTVFIGINVAYAMPTPFMGSNVTSGYVAGQLHMHSGWIAVMSTNSSENYVGPGQCSPYFDLGMRQGSLLYQHLKNVDLNLLTPTRILENYTLLFQLKVTNNENYTLYNVTVLDWDANEFFELRNLTKIDMIEPHQFKMISGNLTFATKDGITCFHYNGGQSKPALGYQISAKNDTGSMMESFYFNSQIGVTILSPLKQYSSGISTNNLECNQGLQLLIKAEDGSPACVTPETANKLTVRGWAKTQENSGTVVTLGEGQRDGPLLVEKIFSDSVQGLDFREYPLATNVGYPITLHIGDSASNGCTVELTLVKIDNNTAIFLKKEYQNRPCPICLSENTTIKTPNGPINVKELKVGMTVFTQDSFDQKQTAIILKTGRTLVPQDHKMVHVVLADKRELYVSPNHPTSDGRLFGELLAGDILDGSKIKSTEQVPYNGTYTYDILPSGPTGFYWANGILVKSTLK